MQNNPLKNFVGESFVISLLKWFKFINSDFNHI